MQSAQCKSIYEETFYIIPRYIRKIPGITLAYLDVYETIFQFWNKNKNCFLSEESLCARTGYQRAIIYRALSFFEKHNELKRIKKNGKRYLVKPERIIETDLLDEEDLSCTENIPTSTTVDSNVYNRILSTSTTVDHNIKNINKENNINNPLTPLKGEKKEKDKLALEDLKKDNPHNIPEQLIKDFLTNRKAKRAPVTISAWARLQKTLSLIHKEKGILPIDAFEEMVANGWQSLKADYFESKKGCATYYRSGVKRLTLDDVLRA